MSEKLRKNHRFSGKIKTVWSKFLSLFKKDKEPGSKPLRVHSKFSALILVQYRDKVDTSWTRSFKTITQKLVFMILKFVVLLAVVVLMLKLVAYIFMIQAEIMDFFLIFLGFYTILNLISVTIGLVKSLYHAEDNKVLATYPVSSTRLFITKIIVYELFELKKSFDILLPISLGFLLTGVMNSILPWYCLIWAILPMVLIITITVLFGALLSIPVLFIYNFLKKHPVVEGITLLTIASAVVVGLVFLINKIPTGEGNVDVIRSFSLIKEAVKNFTIVFSKIVYPINFAYRAMVGESGAYLTNKILGLTVARVGIMIGVVAVLFGLVFLIIKPFYFSMMTKTFEFDKHLYDKQKPNKVRGKHKAFILKEIKLTLRDFDVSGSYLGVYVAVPILLLLIDKVFAAMSTSLRGDVMISAFNVLLIILPLLASSTVVSTIFSREGRTAYMKKTKPIKPYFPLTAKLLFNLVFVIPSIAASCYVFVKFTSADVTCGILLGFIVLFVEYGHIFFSASLDIMNPQNEIYATEGTSISNPNERKSTVVGFLLALLFGGLTLLFLSEGKMLSSFIKLFFIALAVALGSILLFYLKVKAFYIDRQEASRE